MSGDEAINESSVRLELLSLLNHMDSLIGCDDAARNAQLKDTRELINRALGVFLQERIPIHDLLTCCQDCAKVLTPGESCVCDTCSVHCWH